MKTRQSVGLIILVLVAMVIAWVRLFDSSPPNSYKPLTITGNVGGKLDYLNDPAVIKILKDKYSLTVNPIRLGSFEQVDKCRLPLDFCWPSSQVAGQLLLQKLAPATMTTQVVFNSPIVFYSWTPIVDKLIGMGIVQQIGDAYYINELALLVEMIDKGTTWDQIGLPAPYGPIQIYTSDPVKSNTGNSFLGLLANTYNGGSVVDATTVSTVLPNVNAFVDRMGLLPSTTTQLFEQFLNLGMGAAPIIVAYESNLIEYSLLHPGPAYRQRLQNDVRTIYPMPTIWSEQPLIPLTEGGRRLMDALRGPELQTIGWEGHGFRPGNPAVIVTVAQLTGLGVPLSIDSVIKMPETDAMVILMDTISGASSPPTLVSSTTGQSTRMIHAVGQSRRERTFLSSA